MQSLLHTSYGHVFFDWQKWPFFTFFFITLFRSLLFNTFVRHDDINSRIHFSTGLFLQNHSTSTRTRHNQRWFWGYFLCNVIIKAMMKWIIQLFHQVPVFKSAPEWLEIQGLPFTNPKPYSELIIGLLMNDSNQNSPNSKSCINSPSLIFFLLFSFHWNLIWYCEPILWKNVIWGAIFALL